MKHFALIAILLLPVIAEAQEFDVFKSSPIRNRHLTSPLMSFGTSMTLYAAGVKPEIAAPVGFIATALTEHFMHKGRHGITFSEYKMIGVGTIGFYATAKIIDHFWPRAPVVAAPVVEQNKVSLLVFGRF